MKIGYPTNNSSRWWIKKNRKLKASSKRLLSRYQSGKHCRFHALLQHARSPTRNRLHAPPSASINRRWVKHVIRCKRKFNLSTCWDWFALKFIRIINCVRGLTERHHPPSSLLEFNQYQNVNIAAIIGVFISNFHVNQWSAPVMTFTSSFGIKCIPSDQSSLKQRQPVCCKLVFFDRRAIN